MNYSSLIGYPIYLYLARVKCLGAGRNPMYCNFFNF